MAETEIAHETTLCRPDGRVHAEAVGWSRRVVHECRLDRAWGRRKRWHYWCVFTPEVVLSLTLVDLDFASATIAVAVDRASGGEVRQVSLLPPTWRREMPGRADRGTIALGGRSLELRFADHTSDVEIRVRSPRIAADLRVRRPAGHDALGVALSWDERRFAYTCKQPGLPVEGTISIDGVTRSAGADAFACLDWGRGVWPARSSWNWASAAGRSGGRALALNLGARWTDGRGVTENGLWIDGSLTKIASDVSFHFDRSRPERPWAIAGKDVDLTVTPETVQSTPRALKAIGTSLMIAFGIVRGTVLGRDVGELFGWSEELHTRW